MASVAVKGKAMKKKEESRDERCPLCQVPLCLLAKNSQHRHVAACLNKSSASLPGLMFSGVLNVQICSCL